MTSANELSRLHRRLSSRVAFLDGHFAVDQKTKELIAGKTFSFLGDTPKQQLQPILICQRLVANLIKMIVSQQSQTETNEIVRLDLPPKLLFIRAP